VIFASRWTVRFAAHDRPWARCNRRPLPRQRQELERQLQDAQTPRRTIEDDLQDDGGMMGWHYEPRDQHYGFTSPGRRLCRPDSRAQILIAVRFVTVRSKRVTQEVEAFLPGILQRSLGLVECQPSRVIALLVHARASAAYPRLRMTKSSASAMTCARNACPHPVRRQYL
jgi:hypothetical protein